ncbi:hypothetical protein CWI38_0023p0080 [Hamiltosporidium tvaerminnensis]|uniref:Uncharacterized protein n=2 Tax=Hamiltosporidium TaxID=1176354 RepID=A0A4Q9L4B1_9MICR|nr:hypothetical protein CWI37_0592p0020 [Hamiltosporidium tvaerminnensis]TBU04744.1 hypothetical protein CWI36_0719p0010 [Hamiltosporidium magnivora]TBU20774.1 hypothetical protein CWI38_0023p0080 [Hamiltosporidium tvaerminnensis]
MKSTKSIILTIMKVYLLGFLIAKALCGAGGAPPPEGAPPAGGAPGGECICGPSGCFPASDPDAPMKAGLAPPQGGSDGQAGPSGGPGGAKGGKGSNPPQGGPPAK